MTIKKKNFIILAVILFAGQMVYGSVFIVNPEEQIILTRFGKVEKGPIKEPGYHIKFYRFDQVIRYPSKHTVVNLEFTGCPPRIPSYNATMDFIIIDPIMFYQTIYKIESLQERLSYLLNERYCSKKSEVTNDPTFSSISNFINTELIEYGVSIIKIDFKS